MPTSASPNIFVPISLSVFLSLCPMKRVSAFLAASPRPSLWPESFGPQAACWKAFSADERA
jgi:hypothetical protein